MEKEYTNRCPRLEEDQFDLNRALVSMLNCRRYLTSQGFQEVNGKSGDVTGIAGGYAEIVLSNSSIITDESFRATSDSDSLLEMIIEKEARLEANRTYCGYILNAGRERVLVCTYNLSESIANLRIIDTSKLGWFRQKQKTGKEFAFIYRLVLNRGLIRDSDIKQFAKYQQGLEDAMKQDTLLIYSPQVPQRKSTQGQEVEMPQVETHFINPWEVEIPKLGKDE